ncbi:hypothetical protein C9374_013548 [Naegleria lovaniensis]|uniref:5'-3' exoribonuclease 1 n=1 Tax=Naegleria lovaniensis TaxID=51637 RepID=A0AA88KNG1_NAELO|nr:uncharacterized protein C9374_013548 [Naegleria lovaniensis]KAG2392063.1 hypothetical protein C9374_013548 [Naegleria lovaniensis]
MGVPRLFKWLSERYPCIVTSLTEATIPTVDNLYLDMNGIIHNCTHKDDEIKSQLTEKEMILKIFRYIDQLFQLIKPAKYFFLALDGVAPRAKMNQQRSRRFRKVHDEQELRKKLEQKGEVVAPKDNVFDSNCITPGTEFMAKLSEHLKYMIHSKMKNDIRWQKCQVILSGHEVPGEGEHKIMNFIRGRKMQDDYLPNERHCLYGLDADLICLGLVTHEPHFMLLREDVFEQFRQKDSKDKNKPFAEKFHLLHLYALRQYLDFEFREALTGQNLPFPYDLERIVDDFVFFIFFTGNDFLPHMPTLDIKEGSINTMIEIYKKVLPKLPGYLTELGDVHLDRVEQFVKSLAEQEASMMQQRFNNRMRENRRARKRRAKLVTIDSEGFVGSSHTLMVPQVPLAGDSSVDATPAESKLKQQEELFANDGDEVEQDMGLVVGVSNLMDFNAPTSGTYGIDEPLEDDDDEAPIEVEEVNDLLLKSVNEGEFDFTMWHKAYYATKMDIDYSNKEAVSRVYANEISFSDPGVPFRPFEQLLGVLPEGSAKILPEPFRKLYLQSSPIFDFYPQQFVIDREGTRYDYEGVSLLPFIDENRLLEAIKTIDESLLSDAEKKRNTFGNNLLFTYDPSISVTCNTTIVDELPSVIDSHVREQVIELPKYEKFLPQLCKGVKMGKHNLEGFPVLECKHTKVEERDVGIVLFGQPSRKPSLVVNLTPQYSKVQAMDEDFLVQESIRVAQSLRNLIGKRVYVGYPYPRIGILSSIADERASYYDEKSEGEPHDERDIDQFRKEYSYHKNVLLRRYGLDVGNVKVLVFIKLFRGMKRDKHGIKKSFHRDEFAYPASLLMLQAEYHPTLDQRFMEVGPQAIEKEYPMSSTVLILGEQNYGSLAKVSGYEKNLLKVTISDPYSDTESKPVYPKESIEKFASEKYYPFHVAAKKLQISKKALGLIVGSVRLELPNGKLTHNLGLSLRSKKSTKRVVGFCKCDYNEQNLDEGYFLNFDTAANLFSKPSSSKFSVGGTFGDWELSDKALTLIGNFAQQFPDFIEKLGTDLPFTCDNFFPCNLKDSERDKYYQEKVAEITNWVAAQEYHTLPFIDIEKDVLPVSVMKEIEQAAIEFCNQKKTSSVAQSMVIDPSLVHKPEDPCPNLFYVADFALGNRVLHMSGSGSAPFGTKGILVGIDGDNGQVIFDEEFVGGSTFGSRLQTSRGGIVSLKTLANLDHKKYVKIWDDNSRQRSFDPKTKMEYTKQHYFTTSNYNYDLPKSSPSTPTTGNNGNFEKAQSNQQKPKQPYNKQQAGTSNINKKGNQGGTNFKILKEVNNVDQQVAQFQQKQKQERPPRSAQQEKRQPQQQQDQKQFSGSGRVLGSSSSGTTEASPSTTPLSQTSGTSPATSDNVNLASDDFNPSAIFKTAREKHRQNRNQRPEDYLSKLKQDFNQQK